ncbi:MAG: YdcF family protein [Janthinobacterium lividum]
MQSFAVALVFAVLYAYFRQQDQRLMRNGVFLIAAVWFASSGLLSVLRTLVPSFGWVEVVLLALMPLAVIVLAFFLVANGVFVLRAEGRSLANALSFVAGVALLVVPVAAGVLVRTGSFWGIGLGGVLVFVSSYLGVVFVAFLVYSLVYARVPQAVVPAVLVVLGSRVIDGRVPPLLASRLDKALAIYRQTTEAGQGAPPLLIPSGGQGADESRAEGEAMAEYLVAHGADPHDVRAETMARSTEENLVLSRQVQTDADRPGPVLAVTNNYHVLRTALLARRIGSDAQVVGSPTARYYVPSAFLREFAAVLVEHKRIHVAICVPVLVATVLLLGAVSRQLS